MPRELTAYIMSKVDEVAVFCFQEIDEGAPKLLDNILSDEFSSYSASKVVDGELFSITTYVRRDIDVVKAQTILADEPNTGLALRCMLLDSDGREIVVTNVYGTPRPGHKLDTPQRILLSRAG